MIEQPVGGSSSIAAPDDLPMGLRLGRAADSWSCVVLQCDSCCLQPSALSVPLVVKAPQNFPARRRFAERSFPAMWQLSVTIYYACAFVAVGPPSGHD
jgi:hypothetical protein